MASQRFFFIVWLVLKHFSPFPFIHWETKETNDSFQPKKRERKTEKIENREEKSI